MRDRFFPPENVEYFISKHISNLASKCKRTHVLSGYLRIYCLVTFKKFSCSVFNNCLAFPCHVFYFPFSSTKTKPSRAENGCMKLYTPHNNSTQEAYIFPLMSDSMLSPSQTSPHQMFLDIHAFLNTHFNILKSEAILKIKLSE
jgi:hypothetical protein